MVIGKLAGYLALGLIGAFLLNTLIRPASALGTGAALQETGKGIGSIGAGIGSALSEIGRGSAKLFDPLWTLKDLIYDTNVSGSASVGPVSQQQASVNVQTGATHPSSSTYTFSDGTNLTTGGGYVDAILAPLTIALGGGGNGGVSAQSSTYSAGAAQQAGYSTGAPTA